MNYLNNCKNVLVILISISLLVPLITCTSKSPPQLKIPDIKDYVIVTYDKNGSKLNSNTINIPDQPLQYDPIKYIDEYGNLYISHTTFNAKYNSRGELIFKNIFDNNLLWLYLVEADEKGNTYAAPSQNKNNNLILIKYNDLGKMDWQVEYSYPESTSISARRIRIDNLGNVIVAGIFSNGGGNNRYEYSNIFIAKFDARGSLLWQTSYKSQNNVDSISSLQIDSHGDIVLAGSSLSSIPSEVSQIDNFDVIVIKYDSNGQQLWKAGYDDDKHGNDSTEDLTTDANDNIFVTVHSGDNCATLKYDQNGRELWASQYVGPEGKGSNPSGIKYDTEGNVYVAGTAATSIGSSYFTIKYDDTGKEQWVKEYTKGGEGLNTASSLYIDEYGNICVTGQGTTHNQVSFDTVKYTADGNELWIASYPVKTSYDIPIGLIVDSNENIIVYGILNRFSN